MKIFFSENTVNPGYYSFGYSIYGYKEPSDQLSDIYNKGFQPCVVSPDPGELFYMCRGARVDLKVFKKITHHTRVERKFVDRIQVRVYPKNEFTIKPEFISFILKYFMFRHGKNSMPKERLLTILESPFLTHIVEYTIDGVVVAYMLENHGEKFSHVWYQTYAKKYNNSHLGSFIMLDFILRSQKSAKDYAYLGATYGTWMRYKTNYQPLQFWDGREWVHDPKSELLKKILKSDHLRFISFTDAWRSSKKDFCNPPVSYGSVASEIRFLAILMYKTPRVFFLTMIIVGVLILIIFF